MFHGNPGISYMILKEGFRRELFSRNWIYHLQGGVQQMPTNEIQLLQQINQLSFAMHDTALYLDTHPMDTNALDYYHYLKPMKEQAIAEYTASYGPLTMGDVNSNTEWTWINEPWPWEGAGCSCGTMRNDYNIR